MAIKKNKTQIQKPDDLSPNSDSGELKKQVENIVPKPTSKKTAVNKKDRATNPYTQATESLPTTKLKSAKKIKKTGADVSVSPGKKPLKSLNKTIVQGDSLAPTDDTVALKSVAQPTNEPTQQVVSDATEVSRGLVNSPAKSKVKAKSVVAKENISKTKQPNAPSSSETKTGKTKIKKTKPDGITVTFQLRFTSKFGQAIFIVGNHDLLGGNEISAALPMQYFNHEFWYATIDLPSTKNSDEVITYNYFVKNEDGTISMEWGTDKQIKTSVISAEEVLIMDSWNYAGYFENTFYTEPFKNVLLKGNYTPIPETNPAVVTHCFKIKAPLLPKNHVVCLSGSAAELGGWDPGKVLIMNGSQNEDWFTVNVDLTKATFPIAYKYGVYNSETNLLTTFETGDNRVIYDVVSPKKQTILADGFIRLANNTFKGAGISIPVFSLRSKQSLGVGEFVDIKKLVDWAKVVGLKLIQILPVNDTTATHTQADSYPYAAISAFALHPVYINLHSIVAEENKHLLTSLDKKAIHLNAEDAVDYNGVMSVKWEFLKTIFPLQKQLTFSTESFTEFFTTNAHWLVPYAAFCYLRDEYKTADFTKWPAYNTFDVFEINNLATPVLTTKDEIAIHYFIQYHLHLQLKSATEYAHQQGIIVKGDIPIGIFRNSCDAWQQPQLYNMDMQAGAPPDDFAVKGQNWGFPTYNWQRMAEDNFTWWKNRFEQMSYYFDAFRIDHILGFFRIWSIPMNAVEGIMGYFVPAIAVHIKEFNEKHIWFDYNRYVKPFIVDSVIREIFGEHAEYVKANFLEKKMFDNYELLPEFDTQRKVEAYFVTLDQSENNSNIKQGLYNLISNVILFEAEGSQGQQYHFRIGMENTSSFQYLEEGTKQQLKALYINYFFRRQDDFWRREALQKLPELKRSTNMLICGEDLGMVPDCVPGVMKELAILSLEIQRMPKDPSTEFFHPDNAPYLSVVTPSTHDMSTVRGWWEEDRAKTQRFFNNELKQSGNAPYFCEAWVNRAIILQHLYSPAMWSIFQMQDLLGMSDELRRENPAEERINVPSDPKHFWKYRMHLNMEDLLEETSFTNELAEFIKRSGR